MKTKSKQNRTPRSSYETCHAHFTTLMKHSATQLQLESTETASLAE